MIRRLLWSNMWYFTEITYGWTFSDNLRKENNISSDFLLLRAWLLFFRSIDRCSVFQPENYAINNRGLSDEWQRLLLASTMKKRNNREWQSTRRRFRSYQTWWRFKQEFFVEFLLFKFENRDSNWNTWNLQEEDDADINFAFDYYGSS